MTLVKIKRIQYGNVSGFLLYNQQSAVLVDTGYMNTTAKLTDALSEVNKKPEDLDLIILTHTHFDHAGGAYKIKELTGAPVAVHRSEAGYLERGRAPFPKGTRWKGKLIVFAGRIFARRIEKYHPAEPDLLIDKELDLSSFGIPGKVLHTPGHTAGSVSVLLESGEAVVGDNILGLSFKHHFPPFADDMAAVLDSWQTYIDKGMHTLLAAHGGRVRIDAISKELPVARRKYLGKG